MARAWWTLLPVCSLALAEAAISTVCVTGAGGYVATEIVKQLLEAGYRVKGTVRSLKDKAKYEHLERLDAALPGTIEFVEADLLIKGSFDKCAQGAKYFFHVASPFHFESKDMKEEMIKPAVTGTENAMSAAVKAKVDRVIITSSFAASSSFLPEDKPDSGSLYSEEDWNDFIDEKVWKDNPMQAYIASKSLAERAAWEAGRKSGISVVVVQPVLVMGPVHGRRVEGVSVATMKGAVEGKPITSQFPWCDVRDVAKVHIQAATNPAAEGRYIVAHPELIHPSYVHSVLSMSFLDYDFGPGQDAGDNVPIINNSKVLSLIGKLYPLDDTILDMARSLISAGLAKPKAVKTEL